MLGGRRIHTGGVGVLAALTVLGLPALAGAAAITLPDGRGLSPAGRMVAAGDFPGGELLAGGHLLTDTTGSAPNEIDAFDPASLVSVGRTLPAGPASSSAAPWAQTGHLALGPGGTVYAAGGATDAVETFSAAPVVGAPVPGATLAAPGFVGGVAADPDGTHVWASLPFDPRARYDKGSSLVRLDRQGGPPVSVPVGAQPWDVASATVAGRDLVASADRDAGEVSIVDARTLARVAQVPVGRGPAAPTFTPDGHLLVLSSLDDTLVEVDPLAGRVTARLALDPRPGRLGGGPSALAVSPDGVSVYVAMSADNALVVVRRAAPRALALAGAIPTAEYPTGVVLHGSTLLVSAGKGVGGEVGTPVGTPLPALAPFAPGPTGLGVSGALESIPVPDAPTLAAQTAQVEADNGAQDPGSPAAVACTAGASAPIQHVVYVIRENKTYDEEFGDEPGGSPANLMYPRALTPNAHALAERFGLLERFYADEEVSDTGHQWVMGSVANDWVERLSQQAYGLDGAPRQGAELGNGADTLWSPNDYLLDSALAAGISFRDYGEFYRQDQSRDGPAVSPALDAHIVHGFPGFGFDPSVPDTRRIDYWQADFQRDVRAGSFPALEVIYLPEDHTTQGTTSTPQAQVADADLALGRLVATLSASPYWSSTALFMTEDDPQSGLDSVDEHRTVGLVVSPWTRPAQQVSTHLDQTAMLRTVEGLLGLPVLGEHDAGAASMGSLFADHPSFAPFAAATPQVPTAAPATIASLHRRARAALAGRALDALPPSLQRALTQLAHDSLTGRPRPLGAAPIPAPRTVASVAVAPSCTPAQVLAEQAANLQAGGNGARLAGTVTGVTGAHGHGSGHAGGRLRLRILGERLLRGALSRGRPAHRAVLLVRVRVLGASGPSLRAELRRGRLLVAASRSVPARGTLTLRLSLRRGGFLRSGRYRLLVRAGAVGVGRALRVGPRARA